ncbi:MAG: hypothetical protein WBB45_12630 [Cyclobacteriaceae bacterium]
MYALTKIQKQEHKATYLAVLLMILPGALFLAMGLWFSSGKHHFAVYAIIGVVTLLSILYIRMRMKKELNEAYEFQGDDLLFYRSGVVKSRVNVHNITTITHYARGGIYEFNHAAYIREGFLYTKDILATIKRINPDIRYETVVDIRYGLLRYLIQY